MRISDWSSDVCSSDLPKKQHGKPENRRAASHAGEATAKALPDRQAGGTGLGDGTPTIFHTSLASSRPSDRREREPGSMDGPGAGRRNRPGSRSRDARLSGVTVKGWGDSGA